MTRTPSSSPSPMSIAPIRAKSCAVETRPPPPVTRNLRNGSTSLCRRCPARFAQMDFETKRGLRSCPPRCQTARRSKRFDSSLSLARDRARIRRVHRSGAICAHHPAFSRSWWRPGSWPPAPARPQPVAARRPLPVPGLRHVADRVRRRGDVGREGRRRLPHAPACRPRPERHRGCDRRPLVRRDLELRRQAGSGRALRHLHPGGGRMSLHACGYGRELTSGEPDPELPPVPGRVYGRVARYDVDRIREFKSLVPIPSVRIALDRPAGRVIATSDQWGRFQFADVPPGKYQLAVDAGQGLTPWMPETVVLPDREACVDTEIVLRPAGKVSGRVQTADGKPGRRDLRAAAARRAGWQPPRATRRPRPDDGARRPVHVRGTARGQLRSGRQPGGQRRDRAATVRARLVRRRGSRVGDADSRRGGFGDRAGSPVRAAGAAGHAHVHGCGDLPRRLCPAGRHDARDGDERRATSPSSTRRETVRSAR